MKNIKELELLVNFAKSLGQTPDPAMVAKVQEHYEFQKKLLESVRSNAANDLNSAFGTNLIKETHDELVQEKTEIERTPETDPAPHQSDLGEDTERNEESNKADTDDGRKPAEQTLADLAAKFISEAPKDSYQQPDPLVVPNDMDAIRGKLKYLEQWLGKVSMAGPGGGAINIRDQKDVYKANIAPHAFLYYNNTINKFDFTSNITKYVDIENTSRSFGNFYDVTTQPYANIDAGQRIHLGIDAGSKNIALQSNTGIQFSFAGNYLVNYSMQFINTDTSQYDINIWLKRNGNNIVDSNSIFTIPAKKNTQTPGKLIATSPIPVSLQNNDVVELYWHTDTALVSIQTVGTQGPPGPDIPRTPSAIVVVTKM